MRSPFIIIGAQRSGTSKLAHLLDQHPRIRMARPMRPEPKFFMDASEVAKGKEHYLESFFPELAPDELPGEKSTTYIEVPEAGERIRELFPDARILAMLRDPVERAISNFAFSQENGLEHRTLREALIEEKPPPEAPAGLSTDPFAYLERGDYAKYLRPYFRIFPRGQVKVLIKDEFFSSNEAVLDLFRFLGIAPVEGATRSVSEKVNVSSGAEPDPELKRELRARFEASIRDLEKLLGRDLDLWKDR